MNRRAFFAFIALPAFSQTAQARRNEIFRGRTPEVAINGYDVVSYHRGLPVVGNAVFSMEWKSAKWHFSTAENLEAFRSEPEKYAPQYGGYCAYSVAHKAVIASDPNAWSILDGKLYLNYSVEVRQDWLADLPRFIDAANKAWPHVLDTRCFHRPPPKPHGC